jgi:hypothetical protein
VTTVPDITLNNGVRICHSDHGHPRPSLIHRQTLEHSRAPSETRVARGLVVDLANH